MHSYAIKLNQKMYECDPLTYKLPLLEGGPSIFFMVAPPLHLPCAFTVCLVLLKDHQGSVLAASWASGRLPWVV